MKKLHYNFKLVILIFLGGWQLLSAQKFEKKYHESFKVEKNAVVNLNTYYTDVVIETWNRNTVDISANISVEGENLKQAEADKYFKNWQFEALGNKTKVSISTQNNIRFNYGYNYNYNILPELSVINLDILDSFKMVAPLVNDIVLESLKNIKLDSFKFNFDAYKKDKNYLKKWQDKAKKQNFKWQQEYLKDTIARKKRVEELKKVLESAKVEITKQRKEMQKQKQELMKHQKVISLHQKNVTKKINFVLEKRNKLKLKKTILIKVPKGTKFKMNVKYGSVSFPS